MDLSDGVIGLDQSVTLAINSVHSNFSDAVWKVFSNVPVWYPMYAIIVVCLFWRLGWKKALAYTLAIGLTILLCDQLANLCKGAVGRLRPNRDPIMMANGLHVLLRGGQHGFFSGHAANAFGFATCSLLAIKTDKRLKYRGYAVWIIFWAFLVSISRVFVGMHFFGDILVGSIVGIIIGTTVAVFTGLIVRKWIIPRPEGRLHEHDNDEAQQQETLK